MSRGTSSSPAVPYEVMRQPISNAGAIKSAAAALQLPSPAVIDLGGSGTETVQQVGGNVTILPASNWGGGNQPVVVVFSPNGSVNCVYYEGSNPPLTSPIYLLIGRVDGQSNSSDLNSVWVAVNPATGLVITSDMDSTTDPKLSNSEQGNQLLASRHFARQSDAMVGK